MEPAARKANLIWLIFIVASTFIAYIPALRAGWIWDDDKHVTFNIHLHTLHGLRELWLRPGAVPQYYPLTHTAFWIEFRLGGLHPLGYHLDNIILHIANALLIGLILRKLNIPGYALAAAIFALHPVQVETVAWVTERKNVLSTFFYLCAMWVATDVWEIVAEDSDKPNRHKVFARYFLCLALFVCALLSKTVTASLPAAILLLIWWKKNRITRRQVVSLVPFFILGIAFGWHTSWMERHVVGATGPEWSWSFTQRVLIASHAILFYLGKLVWPHPLIFSYPKWNLSWASQWLFLISLCALIAVILKTGRTLTVAVFFFVGTLFPALGFANVYPMKFSFVADHFQYLACIAPIAVAAAIIGRASIGVPIVLLLGIITWNYSRAFADSETLWRDVIAKNPDSLIAHSNLANEYLKQGKLNEAESEWAAAFRLDPHFTDARIGLGLVAEARGDQFMAEQDYRNAIIDDPANPRAYWYLGLWDRKNNQTDDALVQFREAAKFFPNPAAALEQIGEIDLKSGEPVQAETEFRLALQSDPDLLDAHVNLASVYLSSDPPNLAIARSECQIAIEIDPTSAAAWNDLGIANIEDRQLEMAISDFKKALECDPEFAMARTNLAKLGQH